jgi:hypothetical protein
MNDRVDRLEEWLRKEPASEVQRICRSLVRELGTTSASAKTVLSSKDLLLFTYSASMK